MSDHHPYPIVTSFPDLVSTPFHGEMNAVCWKRELKGDFSEIVAKLELIEDITNVEMETLIELQLSEKGNLARERILNDFSLLKEHGASPNLNLIRAYERDDSNPFFPTDVYSFHADRSPVPFDTFLCTYHGAASEILSNSQTIQKVLILELLDEIRKNYRGKEEDFELFLREHFLDLHYQAKPDAHPIQLGVGNLWRLATDHPGSKSLPCVHRAPVENDGQIRLLMIC